MTATDQDIEMSERESKIIDPSPLTNENDEVVNLTDSEIEWKVLTTDPQEDIVIEKSVGNGIQITSAVDGEWEISVDPVDTEGLGGQRYTHEARLTDTNNRESVVMIGEFKITESNT